jgi:hypothetical protein
MIFHFLLVYYKNAWPCCVFSRYLLESNSFYFGKTKVFPMFYGIHVMGRKDICFFSIWILLWRHWYITIKVFNKMTKYETFYLILKVLLQATCYTLAVMSIDRYLYVISASPRPRWRTPLKACIICILIWAGKIIKSC